MADTTGQADLRAETISKIVQGFALQEYTMKQVCMVQPSSSWKESYYVETATELTGGVGSAVKGVPRLANFPYGEVSWTKTSSYLEKYGMEGIISWEDEATNEIDVIARTLLRIARAVASAVDTAIYAALSGASGNALALTAGYEWDSATVANRDPIQDLLNAQKLITEDNYNPYKNTYLLLNPKDFANIMGNANVRNAGQFFTDAVTKNGYVGRLMSMKIIVSNAVTADQAIMIIGQECATWKAAVPLTTVTINDPGVKKTIRSWEVGVTQVTNPNALCKITNTAA